MLPALKQLLQIAKVIAKNSCHKAEKVTGRLSVCLIGSYTCTMVPVWRCEFHSCSVIIERLISCSLVPFSCI